MIKLREILSEIKIVGHPTAKMLSDMNSFLCKKSPTQSYYDKETGERYYKPVEYDNELRDKWEEIFDKYDSSFMWDEEDFGKIPPKLRNEFYKEQIKFKEKYNL